MSYYSDDLIAMAPETDPDTGLPLLVQSRITGHVMRMVQAGPFSMGKNDVGDYDEVPVHDVYKTSFYLSISPVSNLHFILNPKYCLLF